MTAKQEMHRDSLKDAIRLYDTLHLPLRDTRLLLESIITSDSHCAFSDEDLRSFAHLAEERLDRAIAALEEWLKQQHRKAYIDNDA